MKKINFKIKILSLSIVSLLAACGGSGDDLSNSMLSETVSARVVDTTNSVYHQASNTLAVVYGSTFEVLAEASAIGQPPSIVWNYEEINGQTGNLIFTNRSTDGGENREAGECIQYTRSGGLTPTSEAFSRCLSTVSTTDADPINPTTWNIYGYASVGAAGNQSEVAKSVKIVILPTKPDLDTYVANNFN